MLLLMHVMSMDMPSTSIAMICARGAADRLFMRGTAPQSTRYVNDLLQFKLLLWRFQGEQIVPKHDH